jgi:hypothetical protein
MPEKGDRLLFLKKIIGELRGIHNGLDFRLTCVEEKVACPLFTPTGILSPDLITSPLSNLKVQILN